jgi:tungstate transport system substrate-binding protein
MVGCGGEAPASTTAGSGAASTSTTGAVETTADAAERSDLVLASTTSTQDSGLFDVLIPAFESAYPQYTVKVVAVGSGEALKLGETGDADVLLVHSPASEKTFMEQGYGIERKAVMYNDFIIVGPADDPARIRGISSAPEALAAIASAGSPFFTRADDSGTHNKEKALWKAAGIEPSGEWYQSTGQGMGETLTIADQKAGYTLSDRATFLTKKAALGLEILVEGDEALFNQYHVITVKNGRNQQGARDFMDWIVSEAVQQEVIAPFGKDVFGSSLFVPNAGRVE